MLNHNFSSHECCTSDAFIHGCFVIKLYFERKRENEEDYCNDSGPGNDDEPGRL